MDMFFANTQAAQAMATANHAEDVACVSILSSYQNTGDVNAARAYASCVEHVYGNGMPTDPHAIIFLKCVICILLVAYIYPMLFSKTWNKQDRFIFEPFISLLGAVIAMLVIALIGGALLFIFEA